MLRFRFRWLRRGYRCGDRHLGLLEIHQFLNPSFLVEFEEAVVRNQGHRRLW